MTPTQYQLWMAVYNAGLKSGLSGAQALAEADRAAATIA